MLNQEHVNNEGANEQDSPGELYIEEVVGEAAPAILTLPTEILLHILQFLSVKDIAQLALTARPFLEIWRDDKYWEYLCKRNYGYLLEEYERLAKARTNYEVPLFLPLDYRKIYAELVSTDQGLFGNINILFTLTQEERTKALNKTFILAAKSGALWLCKLLYLMGADTLYQDKNENSVIHHAVYNGRLAVSQFLLRIGVPVDRKGINHTQPIHHAVAGGHQQVAALLLQHGADINAGNLAKERAIHYAAKYNKPEILPWLIEQGVKLEAVSELGLTPLFQATREANVQAVEQLLKLGAKPNCDILDKHNTPLLHAIANDKTEHPDRLLKIANLLLDHKANFNKANGLGLTPLTAAILSKKFDLAKRLLALGAEVNPKPVSNSLPKASTPLEAAVEIVDHELVEQLLYRGANIYTDTPLNIRSITLGAQNVSNLLMFERLRRACSVAKPTHDQGKLCQNSIPDYTYPEISDADCDLILASYLPNSAKLFEQAQSDTKLDASNNEYWRKVFIDKYGSHPILDYIKQWESSFTDKKPNTPVSYKKLYCYFYCLWTIYEFIVPDSKQEHIDLAFVDHDIAKHIFPGNEPKDSAIHDAVNLGRKDVVFALCVVGKAIHAINGNGDTPLQLAVAKDRKDLIDILINCGAISAEDLEDRRKLSLKFLLTWADKHNRLDIISEIIDNILLALEKTYSSRMLLVIGHEDFSKFTVKWIREKAIEKLVICLQKGILELYEFFKGDLDQRSLIAIFNSWLAKLSSELRPDKLMDILTLAADYGYLEVMQKFLPDNYALDEKQVLSLIKKALNADHAGEDSNHIAIVRLLVQSFDIDINNNDEGPLLLFLLNRKVEKNRSIYNEIVIPDDLHNTLAYLYKASDQEYKKDAIKLIKKYLNDFESCKSYIRNLKLVYQFIKFLSAMGFLEPKLIALRKSLFLMTYRTILYRAAGGEQHSEDYSIIAGEIIYLLYQHHIAVNPPKIYIDSSTLYNNIDTRRHKGFYMVCKGLNDIYGADYYKTDIQTRIPQLYAQQVLVSNHTRMHTRMHHACKNNDIDKLQRLITLGGRIDIKDADGFTPTELATSDEARNLLEFVTIMRSNRSRALRNFLSQNQDWMTAQLDNLQANPCLVSVIMHASTAKVKILRDFYDKVIEDEPECGGSQTANEIAWSIRFLNDRLQIHIDIRKQFCDDINKLIDGKKRSWINCLMRSYDSKETALNTLANSITTQSDKSIREIIDNWKRAKGAGNKQCNSKLIQAQRSLFFKTSNSDTNQLIQRLEQQAKRLKL